MIRTILFIASILIWSCQSKVECDLLVKNANIYDGLGNAPKKGDIAISNGEITKIGNISVEGAKQIIDAAGLAVSPGFIDLHAHLEPLPIIPEAQSAIRMGVTTALGGPDGGSPLRIGKYLDSLVSIGMNINVAYLIGHNAVRSEIMALDSREPTPEELGKMKILVAEAMDDGAFGISTGLKYLPGAFAKTDEVIELSKVAAQNGGIYTSHLREEGLGLIEGVAEAIRISEEAEIPVVLTHHKAIGKPMWGKSKQTLSMVDSARALGLDIMIDQYPYTASYTGISVLIPPWSMEGGRYDKFAERCKDPILRDSIKRGIEYNILNDRGGGDLKRIQLARFPWKPELEGKTLYDWALQEGMDPNASNGAELVIMAQLNRGASAIYHAMSEEDVERIMRHPYTMIASDGRITAFEKGFPHPRVHGTFPRVLGHYVREKKNLSLEDAIRKMTSLPADRLGLSNRGRIAENTKADLVIFNPESIIDKATFTEPHQYPEGIDYVIVNGEIILEKGKFHDLRKGQILRGASYKNGK